MSTDGTGGHLGQPGTDAISMELMPTGKDNGLLTSLIRFLTDGTGWGGGGGGRRRSFISTSIAFMARSVLGFDHALTVRLLPLLLSLLLLPNDTLQIIQLLLGETYRTHARLVHEGGEGGLEGLLTEYIVGRIAPKAYRPPYRMLRWEAAGVDHKAYHATTGGWGK